MKEKKQSVEMANNSNHSTQTNVVNTLPEVEITDATQTRGKVSGNFTICDQAKEEEKAEKVDKNKLFSVELADYFCPIRFDSSQIEAALNPLVSAGIMSEESKNAAIDKAKKEFLEANSSLIEASNNLSFSEVLAKLQANQTLYKKVCTTCNVTEIRESDYIRDGKLCIYRANQSKDKDGNDRYTDATLKQTENGKVFEVPLYVEYREVNTTNILLAIRYRQSYLDAAKRLINKVSDWKRILSDVAIMAKKAKENGFTLSQINEAITKVFEESTITEK